MESNKLPQINCLGYNIFKGSLEQIDLTKKTLINTINQYSWCMAEVDSYYKEALCKSDILLPDGSSIVVAAQFLNNARIKKIAGADLHQNLLERLQKKGGSCFYLGSSVNTLSKIKERLSAEYPEVHAGFYSPPFKKVFSVQDNLDMIAAVNEFDPDVLFVGMTAPKQEKWAYAHRDKLNTKVICSIGAVFDFYAGTVERPGSFWIKIGMEWFVRLLKEPKRMWRRYLYYGPVFIWAVIRLKLKSIFLKIG